MTTPDTPLDLAAIRADWQDWIDLRAAGITDSWHALRMVAALGERMVDALAAVTAERDEARSRALTYLANQGNLNLRLEQELATVTQQRDQLAQAFRAQQAENERVHGKVREQYDVIEHAKKQRDEAIGQAKQAQAVIAAARAAAAYILEIHPQVRDDAQRGWFHPSTLRLIAAVDALATPAAAPKADDDEPFDCAPECRCGRGKPLPAAAPDTADTCGHQHARLLRQPGDRPILCTLPAGHDGDHGEPETESHWDRDSLFGAVATSDPRRVDATPVPAGGEDGSGTADGEVPA